jgi:dTDP-4-dehydrorhamnose reductase
MSNVRVLILGVSGMLGHAVFRHFARLPGYTVFGTVRSKSAIAKYFNEGELNNITSGIDAENFDSFIKVFAVVKPDVVINCIGVIKHLPEAKDSYISININAFLPHRLAKLCSVANARLVHISTDCVYDGVKGNYVETDLSNAEDLYGKSKYLGEVDYPNAVTLRTSIIGHEFNSDISLLDWFLSQTSEVNGYINAIYTGLPTYELARVIEQYVLPNHDLHGLYHVSSDKISKFDLLQIVAKHYAKVIKINSFTGFTLDRSLDSTKFRQLTKYVPPTWDKMVSEMHKEFINNACYSHKHIRRSI